MQDILTTKQLQELLQVDRTTIYRMLSDGRLSGVRVGGQWRFPRKAIEEQLLRTADSTKALTASEPQAKTDLLPVDCFQPIQDVFAQAAGVGAVTTDLQGKMLTTVSNSCAFCDLILTSTKGRQRCESSWARLAQSPYRAPRVERCHAGLAYARGRVEVGDEFVGMLFAGQFIGNATAHEKMNLGELAEQCEIPEDQLRVAAQTIRVIEPERTDWLLSLEQKVADTFSHIGQRQLDLLSRLAQVAKIAQM